MEKYLALWGGVIAFAILALFVVLALNAYNKRKCDNPSKSDDKEKKLDKAVDKAEITADKKEEKKDDSEKKVEKKAEVKTEIKKEGVPKYVIGALVGLLACSVGFLMFHYISPEDFRLFAEDFGPMVAVAALFIAAGICAAYKKTESLKTLGVIAAIFILIVVVRRTSIETRTSFGERAKAVVEKAQEKIMPSSPPLVQWRAVWNDPELPEVMKKLAYQYKMRGLAEGVRYRGDYVGYITNSNHKLEAYFTYDDNAKAGFKCRFEWIKVDMYGKTNDYGIWRNDHDGAHGEFILHQVSPTRYQGQWRGHRVPHWTPLVFDLGPVRPKRYELVGAR